MVRKKKKNNMFFRFIYLLLFIVTILFIVSLGYLNMLPAKYFYLIICGVVVLLGIFGLVLLNSRVKKGAKMFFTLASLVLIATMGVIGYETINFKDVINKATSKIDYKTENYSVIVLKDSNYEKIEDLENKSLGYLDNNSNGTKKALENIAKKAKTTKEDYDDVSELSDDLLKEKVDSIVIEDSYKAILNEEKEKFSNSTKVIYTFSVKVPDVKQSKKVDVTKEPFNVYITGIDTYGKISSVSRSDVNIVATVNPNTHKVLLTSIPRDYYVTLHSKKQKDKLTHAGIYGVDESVTTIEDLLDMKINYYVKVNFTSVVNLVNELDGITVHSDYNFVSEDGYRYVVGDNQLNGKKTLSFARERHAFQDGDIQRGKDQMYIIEGIANELMSFSSVTKFNSLLDAIDGSFETNMSSDEISKLIKKQINDQISWQIDNNYLEGIGSSQTTYTVKAARQYVMEPDLTSVASAKTKISKIMNEE